MNFRSPKRILLALSAVAACALFGAGAAYASFDPPLSKGQIIQHWDRDPGQNPDSYVANTVKPRGVNFLPTQGVRRELRDAGVPDAVIESLRLNQSDQSKFTFQVWEFSAPPRTLAPAARAELAHRIVSQLQAQQNNLSGVFRHFKPPDPEVCVETGRACPNSSRPRVHIKGTVVRENGRLKARFRLSYITPENTGQRLGEPRVTVISGTSDEGLNEAARDIVQKVHENLRGEMLWD